LEIANPSRAETSGVQHVLTDRPFSRTCRNVEIVSALRSGRQRREHSRRFPPRTRGWPFSRWDRPKHSRASTAPASGIVFQIDEDSISDNHQARAHAKTSPALENSMQETNLTERGRSGRENSNSFAASPLKSAFLDATED
jgi:hypothetical protein